MQLFLRLRGQQKWRHHLFWSLGKKDREGELDQQRVKVLSLAEKEWPGGRRRQREDWKTLRLVIRYSERRLSLLLFIFGEFFLVEIILIPTQSVKRFLNPQYLPQTRFFSPDSHTANRYCTGISSYSSLCYTPHSSSFPSPFLLCVYICICMYTYTLRGFKMLLTFLASQSQ